jgi:hypothetical protein
MANECLLCGCFNRVFDFIRPFCEIVLKSFGKWDEILNDHAFYHLPLVLGNSGHGGENVW